MRIFTQVLTINLSSYASPPGITTSGITYCGSIYVLQLCQKKKPVTRSCHKCPADYIRRGENVLRTCMNHSNDAVQTIGEIQDHKFYLFLEFSTKKCSQNQAFHVVSKNGNYDLKQKDEIKHFQRKTVSF